MSRSKSTKGKSKPKAGLVDDVMEYMTQAIAEADEQAAAERVAELREAQPDATPQELIDTLIRQKSMKTGAVGAVTSGASAIPGLGTMVSLTFGVAADIGMTFKLQAELVLEIAAVYQRQLTPMEKRNAVLLITGISAGANQALSKAGTKIAQKATERLAQKSMLKAVPGLGVAASAGTNILTTYIIGQRANAYFSLGPESVGDWAESVRALSGVDERKIIAWLVEAVENAWHTLGQSLQNVAKAVIAVGQSAGELVVTGASKAGQTVVSTGKSVIDGAGTVVGVVGDAGKKAGEGIAAGVGKAGEVVSGVGKGVVEGASAAAGVVVDAGKKAGEGIVTGVGKIGEAAADVGKEVVERADAAQKQVSKTIKEVRRGKGPKEATEETDLEPSSDES